MPVIRMFRNAFVIVFFLFNVCRAIEANAQLAVSGRMDNGAGTAPSASGVVMQQHKSMLSLLNADKLELPSAAAGDAGVAETGQEASGSRQTRQVILPYATYGGYYGGYRAYYPYSYYTYRPYYYYRPSYSYGLPFYLYG
uniref:Uncharacterized protein n=1 Tax=Bactrocera latifrons TaxID=174628 RepID=A0A0K8WBB9_BACLA